MRKHKKHYAGALAVALATTSAVSMLTPTSNSDSAKLFSGTSNFSIIVKAATSVTIGDKTDFTTSGVEITGLSQAGLDKVNSADKIILKIPAIDGIKTIKNEAFSSKFNN